MLLIEDSKTYAMYVCENLKDIADITVVMTAAEAIKAQAETEWDAIISDVVVPGAISDLLVDVLVSRATCPVYAISSKPDIIREHAGRIMEKTDENLMKIRKELEAIRK